MTSNLDTRFQLSHHHQGQGRLREEPSSLLGSDWASKFFDIKILPVSDCAPKITLQFFANLKILKIRGGRGISIGQDSHKSRLNRIPELYGLK